MMMLPSDTIGRFWDYLKPCIEGALSPNIDGTKVQGAPLLEALITGTLQCWVCSVDRKISCVITTMFAGDILSRKKELFVYSMYGLQDLSPETWAFMLGRLRAFGKGKGCTSISAYSDIPYVQEMVKNLGGRAQYTLLELEV